MLREMRWKNMFLKRLELIGFKSFAQKTALEFPGGIVAIVGPNGSGKSNVIDAVRWILGEREAKNLRGGKSEDLIFAGTPERARLGMAEVRLSFDNSSGFFPVESKEITISRQVTRDGTSQYYLNKSEIRLKDVIDFFAKSRLGVKGLSIINQGDSDIFVRSTPMERRAMIEEILGLREFQLKKQEAERKLKNTLINIKQVQATLEELKPHLRLLKRQTSKWAKRSEIAALLTNLENRLYSFKLAEIKTGLAAVQDALAGVDEKIKELKKEEAEKQAAFKKIESSQPEQLKALQKLRKEQNAMFEKRSSLQKSLSRLDAKIEFIASSSAGAKEVEQAVLIGLLRDIQNILRPLADGDSQPPDWDKVKALFKELTARIDEVLKPVRSGNKSEQSLLVKEKEALLKELDSVNSVIEELAGKEKEISASLEGFNASFKAAFREVEDVRQKLGELETQKNKHLFERERLNMKLGDLEMQVAQAGRRMDEFSVIPAAAIDNIFETEKSVLKLRGELAAIGEVDEALLKEAQETENRYEFLTGQLADLQKSSDDLQKLIGDLEERIHGNFKTALVKINEEFNKFARLMFGGGKARLFLEKPSLIAREADAETSESKPEIKEDQIGIEVEISIPGKKIKGLDMLSGGERSLVSIAALFAMVSVSPPPFLVLDEIDAALDEHNAKKFASLLKEFSKHTQFIIVTHNRHTMEAASVLYGITMQSDGTSKVLSVKLENASISTNV